MRILVINEWGLNPIFFLHRHFHIICRFLNMRYVLSVFSLFDINFKTFGLFCGLMEGHLVKVFMMSTSFNGSKTLFGICPLFLL